MPRPLLRESGRLRHSVRVLRTFVGPLDRLITEERTRVYPAIFLILALLALLASGFGARSEAGVALPDFLARWTGGRMLVEGHADLLYEPALQAQIQREAGLEPLSWFVSPPFVAAALVPFALLPYGVAAVIWAAISLGCLTASLRLLQDCVSPQLAERWGLLVLVVAASQPIMELVGSGQDSAILLLIVVLGIRLLTAGKDATAGLVLALGLAKPHLIFLVPVALLLLGRTRAVLGFVAGGSVLLAMSWLVVGAEGLWQWLSIPRSPVYQQEVQLGQSWKGASLQAWLTALAPPEVRSGWHIWAVLLGLALCLPAVLILRTARGRRELHWAMALMLTTTVVCSPHAMVYDLVLLLPALVFIVDSQPGPLTRVALAVLFLATWLSSGLHLVGQLVPWPLSAVDAPWSSLAVLALWLRLLIAAPQARLVRLGTS